MPSPEKGEWHYSVGVVIHEQKGEMSKDLPKPQKIGLYYLVLLRDGAQVQRGIVYFDVARSVHTDQRRLVE